MPKTSGACCEMHTDGYRNRQFTVDFAEPQAAAVARPRQTHRAVGVQTDWSDDDKDIQTPAEISRAKVNGRKRGRAAQKHSLSLE